MCLIFTMFTTIIPRVDIRVTENQIETLIDRMNDEEQNLQSPDILL